MRDFVMKDFGIHLTRESLARVTDVMAPSDTVDDMTRSISRARSAKELRRIIHSLEMGHGWEGIDTVNRARYMQCLKASLARLEGRG